MRLPLIPAHDITDQQRPLYDAFINNVTNNFPDITTTTDDGALLGPWGVWIQVPTVGAPMMDLIEAIRDLTGLSAAARQVAILITGARFNAAYEIYAHTAAAHAAGLTDAQILTLLAGGRPNDLDEFQAMAADVAHALGNGGPLPEPIYTAAQARFGQNGLNALILTVAQYSFVGVMLNAYDVTSPARPAAP